MAAFKQVGVRAVVHDHDRFISDIVKMTSAIRGFQAQAGKVNTELAASQTSTAAGRAAAETAALKAAARDTAVAFTKTAIAATEVTKSTQAATAAELAHGQAVKATGSVVEAAALQQERMVNETADRMREASNETRAAIQEARQEIAAAAQQPVAAAIPERPASTMSETLRMANTNAADLRNTLAIVRADFAALGRDASASGSKLAGGLQESAARLSETAMASRQLVSAFDSMGSSGGVVAGVFSRIGQAISGAVTQGAQRLNGMAQSVRLVGSAMEATGSKIASQFGRIQSLGQLRIGLLDDIDRMTGELAEAAGSVAVLERRNEALAASYNQVSRALDQAKGQLNAMGDRLDKMSSKEREEFLGSPAAMAKYEMTFSRLNKIIADLERQQAKIKASMNSNEQAMNELRNATMETVGAIALADAAVDELGDSMARSAASINRLGVQMQLLRASGIAVAVGMRAASSALSGLSGLGGIAISAMGGGAAALSTALVGIGRAAIVPQRAIQALGSIVQRTGTSVRQAGDAWFKYGNSLRFYGQSLLFIVTLPIVGAIAGMTRAAISFEDAWAGVVKTVNDTNFQILNEGATSVNDLTALGENLQGVFRQLALEIPIPTVELLNLGRVAGQMGVRGVANLRAFVEVMGQLGATTDIAAEDAATSMARLINLTGGLTDAELAMIGFSAGQIKAMSGSERFQQSIRALGGVLVHLGNNVAATESEIVKLAEKIAAAGSVVAGFSGVQILGIAAAFRASGIAAEKGGTAFTKLLFNISEAVQTGNDHLNVFARTASLSAEEFSAAWQENPAEAFRRFIEGLKFQGDEVINTFIGIEEESARLKEALLSVSKTGLLTDILGGSQNIGLVAEAIAKTSDNLNALEIEAAIRFSTTQSQLQLLKNSFTELGVVVGSFVLPIVNSIAKQLILLASVVADLDPGLQKFVLAVALLAAAAGPAVIVIGLIGSTIGLVVRNIGIAIAAVGGLASALGFIAAPAAAVAVALAGLGIVVAASISKMRKTSDSGLKSFGKKMYEYGKNIVISFARGMAVAVGAVLKVLMAIGRAIAKWLKPGSPPKILPDLDIWGRQAMQEYMDGWTTADFGVFNEISGRIESLLRSITPDGGVNLIERIFASREAVAEMIDQITRFGEVTQAHLDRIYEAMGGVSENTGTYIRRLFELAAATEKVSRAQENLSKITARYDQALRPLNDRLAEISRRQKQIQDQARIAELEVILADSSSTDLARELASLELEQISIEADVSQLNRQKDIETELAQRKLDAAKAEEEAAKELLAASEALLEVQEQNNQLWAEMQKAIEEINESLKEAAEAAKEAVEEAGDSLGEIAEGFEEDMTDAVDNIDLGSMFDMDEDIDALATLISEEWKEISTQIMKDWAPVMDLWDQLGTTWLPIITLLAGKIGGLLPTVKQMETFFNNVDTATSNFATTVETKLTPVIGDLLLILEDLGIISEEEFTLPEIPEGEDPTGLYGLYLDLKEIHKSLTTAVADITKFLTTIGTEWLGGFSKGLSGLDFVSAAEGILGVTPIDIDTLLNDFLTGGLTPEFSGKVWGSITKAFGEVVAVVQENGPTLRAEFEKGFTTGLSGEENNFASTAIADLIKNNFDPGTIATAFESTDIDFGTLFQDFLTTGATPELTGKTVGYISRLVAGFVTEYIRQHQIGMSKIQQYLLEKNKEVDFSAGLSDGIGRIAEVLRGSEEKVRGAIAGIVKALDPLVKAIKAVFDDPSIKGTIQDTIDTLKGIGEDIGDFLGELGDSGADVDALKKIVETVAWAAGWIAKLGALFASLNLAASIGSIIGFVNMFLHGIRMVINGLLEFGMGGAAIIDGFVRLIAAQITFIEDLFAGKGIVQAIENFYKNIDGVGKQILGGLGTIIGAVGDFVSGFFTLLFSPLFAIGKMVDAVIAWFMYLWNELVGHSIIPEMIDAIIAAFGRLVTLPATVAGYIMQIITTLAGMVAEFFTKGAEFVQNIIDGFLSLPLVEDIIALITEVVTGIGEQVGEFLAKGTEFVQNVIDGFHSIDIVTDIVTFVAGIIPAIQEKVGEFFTLGANIIEGLINGIKSIDVVETMTGIAQTIIDTISGRVQENSPSLVFFSIGSNITLGLLYGLQANSSAIMLAMVSLTNAVITHTKLWATQMQVVFSGMMLLIATAISEGQAEILTLFTSLMEQVLTVWEEGLIEPLIGDEGVIVVLTERTGQMFEEMISKIKKQVEGLTVSVLRGFVEMGHKMAGLKGELEAAAEEMMSGLAQVISVAAQEAQNAGVAAANAIIAAFQQAIDKINEANELAGGGGGGNSGGGGGGNGAQSDVPGTSGASGAPFPRTGPGAFATPPPITIPVEFVVNNVAPAVAPVINMGGQTINNGMDGHRLTFIIENALADALRYRTK